jgi:2-polyprenyl-3-methyl-5-hydroxy-6-metoxy-1,4-benzoquinol methylase
MTQTTREPQYQDELELAEKYGFARFGLMTNQAWRDDPKRLLFTLSRYKFVAKMLAGKRQVLEVGCADAFGTRLVVQEGCRVTATDFDPVFIEDVRERQAREPWPCETLVHDILEGPVPPRDFDAAYSLDVIEHIPPADEDQFVGNIAASVTDQGVVLIGSPSLESQAYASPTSLAGHVNCKTGQDLKRFLQRYFENVFMFSMNDEMVHTGFQPMAHYLMALCVTPKR